jgi:hypothetical protein
LFKFIVAQTTEMEKKDKTHTRKKKICSNCFYLFSVPFFLVAYVPLLTQPFFLAMKRHSDALDTLIKVKHEGTTRDLLCCLEATTVAQLEARVRGLFPSLSSAPLRMLGGGIILSNQAPHTLLAHFKGKVKTIQVLAQKQSLEEVKAQETKVMEREDLLQEETDYDKILERQEYVPWWGRSPLSKFNAIQSYTPKERLELARHAAYTGNMPVLKHLLVRGYLEQPDPSHAFDMIQVSSFSPPPSFSPYKKNMFLFPSQVMEAAIQSQCREHQVAMVEHINQSAFVHALAPGGHARLLAPLTVQCLPQAAKLGRMAILRHFLSPGNYDNVNDSTLGELAQTAFDGGHSKVGTCILLFFSCGGRVHVHRAVFFCGGCVHVHRAVFIFFVVDGNVFKDNGWYRWGPG